MLKSIILLCNWSKSFILGVKKTFFFRKKVKNSQPNQKRKNNRFQPSPLRVKRAMKNAGSNMGLMEDAVECWDNLPSKTKYQTIKEWKERYSKR
jgi:hypothetical protein